MIYVYLAAFLCLYKWELYWSIPCSNTYC